MEVIEIVELEATNMHLVAGAGPEVFDNQVDARQLEAFVKDPGHLMVLAIGAEGVVGFASGVMNFHPDKAPVLFLSEIGTVPERRRQGIATRLAKALIALGKTKGCDGCWLATELDNAAARGLYKALGARETRDIVVYDWDAEL